MSDRKADGHMDANPIDILDGLTAAKIKERLAKIDAEADALRVLLRSARARERNAQAAQRRLVRPMEGEKQ